MQEVKNLLSQVTAINRKYEGIGRITGENFNIFKLLGVASSEVRTHSMFLAELLNPRGSHQQEAVFLNLFVKRFLVQDFDTASAMADVEFYIGAKTATTGGRIDILVRDKTNRRIIIENKIYAGDQENQLLRYYNYDKGAKLFYLSLDGEVPSNWSTGGQLKEGEYTIISYSNDVLGWLEDCKKEAVNLPVLRETIAQYVHLIKYLTNQTANHKMQEEITRLVLKDEENLQAFVTLYEASEAVLSQIITRLHESLKEVADQWQLTLAFDVDRNYGNTGFWFKGGQLAKHDLMIGFEFERKWTQNLYFGLCNSGDKPDKAKLLVIQEKFREAFGEVSTTDAYPAWAWWNEYRWWGSETYFKVYQGEFSRQAEEKVQKMLSIVNCL